MSQYFFYLVPSSYFMIKNNRYFFVIFVTHFSRFHEIKTRTYIKYSET